MSRRTWIQDIIKFSKNHGQYVYKNKNEESYQIFDPDDSQFQRLLDEAGINKEDCIYCEFAIRLGDASVSGLDPFESLEAALDWIKLNSMSIYFLNSTHPELKRKFPDIPIKLHPKEVESAFGVFEPPTLSSKDLAKETGKDISTIRRLAPQIPGAENPSGSGWVFPESAIQWVKNRPETRGRKKMISDGFGNSWEIKCPACGKETMHVVRPGKVQCSECIEKE